MVDFAKLNAERRARASGIDQGGTFVDLDEFAAADDPYIPEDEAAAADAPGESPLPPEYTLEVPEVLRTPNNYLSGRAGTGKTTMAKAMVRQLKGTVLAATTGIAAVNLGEGTTINALLKYFDTASLQEAWTSGYLGATLGKLWRAGVRRILLDEVSMMDGDQLTILHRALQELAGRGYGMDAELQDEIDAEAADGDTADPIALTLIGDMGQLPPVKAPFVFESPEWGPYAANLHRLEKVWRQDEQAFIAALQGIRTGQADAAIEFFRPRLVASLDNTFGGSTIVATNDAVDRYNSLRMDKLTGPVHVFAKETWGTQRGDWKQIPERFGLKVGALVMLLSNLREPSLGDRPGRLIYANGDLAIVEALDGPTGLCHVRLQRTGKTVEVEWVTRQNTIPLIVGRRKALRAEGHEERITKDGRMEVVGEVTYLPVRVAYATTVHKSQGLSLDAVQVNTSEGFFKTPGMLYVALSRARTAHGLRVIGTVDGLRARCTVNAKVTPWV